MNEQFVEGFFKEYFDLGSRFKERFTQQFNRTDELSDANHKLTLEVKILKDKIDDLEDKELNLQLKVDHKDYLIEDLKEEIKDKTEGLKESRRYQQELKKSSNVKSLEIRRLEKENRKMSEQIKIVESRFAEIVTERSKLVTENKELGQTVLVRDEKIKNLEEKLKVHEAFKKRKSNLRSSVDSSPPSKRARSLHSRFKDGSDDFCWICHRNSKVYDSLVTKSPSLKKVTNEG